MGRINLAVFASAAALVLSVVWSSCQEPTRWSVPVEMAVLQDTLTVANLLPDSLWTAQDDAVVLSYQGVVAQFDFGDQVQFSDTSWTDVNELPFSGGPVPIPPGTEIWGETDEIDFVVDGVDLRRVQLASGTMTIGMSSTIQGPLHITYEFPGSEFPGYDGPVVDLVVDGDTVMQEVNLAGAWLVLESDNGLEFNKLLSSFAVSTLDSAADDVPVYGTDVTTVSFKFEGVNIAKAEGWFGQPVVDVSGTMGLGSVGQLDRAEVLWEEIDCELYMANSLGLDLAMTLNGFSRWSDGESLALEHPAFGQQAMLSRAVISESAEGQWTVQPTSSWTLDLSDETTNVISWADLLPDSLSWDVELGLNPLGDVTGGYDRIDFDHLPELIIDLNVPLRVRIDALQFSDTTDTKGVFESDCESCAPFTGDLVLQVDNSFGLAMTLYAVTVPSSSDFLFYEPLLLLEGAVIPAEGQTTLRIPIDFTLWRVLSEGRGIAWTVDMNTQGALVEMTIEDRVVVHGWLDGEFNWEIR
ncbi:MAG: hypothetical protein P8M07_00250 [Flavobacteriales bacterium]|nr:hypothetical protein [Flavobacteriales bacterium]